EVRAAADEAAGDDQELREQCNGIGLAVRLDCAYHLSGQPVERGLSDRSRPVVRNRLGREQGDSALLFMREGRSVPPERILVGEGATRVLRQLIRPDALDARGAHAAASLSSTMNPAPPPACSSSSLIPAGRKRLVASSTSSRVGQRAGWHREIIQPVSWSWLTQ